MDDIKLTKHKRVKSHGVNARHGRARKMVRGVGSLAVKHRATAKRNQIFRRGFNYALAFLFVFSMMAAVIQPYLEDKPYNLSQSARAILPRQNPNLGKLLNYDAENGKYDYNQGYAGEISGDSGVDRTGTPRFTANFGGTNPSDGMTVVDTNNNISFTLKPKFRLREAKKEENQLIYQLGQSNGYLVYTAHVAAVKEDIIIESYSKDKLEFEYELGLESGLEARMEPNGAVGVYGSSLPINGNVTTGSEADAALLDKARTNAKKDKLIFEIPAPIVIGQGKKVSNTSTSYFELDGNKLTIVTTGLKEASYPLSIDPTVYIETAQKLMRGNNETNTDFDTSNELIQKSQTTGARIDAWEGNLDFNNGTWDHGVAAAGGYIYRTGGRTDPSKPSVVSTTQTLNTSTSSFALDMPAERPAGDLYIAMMCHDGSDGGADSPPGGWTQITDQQGFIAYYKVGTDQGGGNESASYSWGGYGTEEWAGAIIRITNFDSGDPISGTPGTTSAGSGTPQFPATTPDNDATLVVRATGFDQDNPSSTAWVPSGHTKLGSSSSSGGGNNSCGYAAASLDTPPASGVSTGTASFADGSVNDDYGSMSIAINPVSVTPGVQDSVQWAKFNSTTLEIESPNPGNGVCSGWCSESVYDLPEARRGHATIAYNGYLYVIGGSDGTNRESTVFIAKLGANGEPQLWHPTGGTPVYWYTDTGLNGATARSYLSAVAYNNRLYVLGGQTNASSGGVTTVEYADIKPNGTLGSWSTGTALPSARHGHSIQIYNDVLYLIGGNSSGTLQSSVYYVKINSNGSLNSWTATTSFTTARSSWGGSFTTVWAGYIYLTGGCSAVNGSGYCTTVASDTQLGSINADGSISEWGSITNLTNQRMGYSIIGWQNGLYRLGGCAEQNTSTGVCLNTLPDVDFGVINPAGEVSTVNISTASGAGTCTGGSPYNCNIPDPGDDADEGGNLLSMAAIMNGYLYHIGGCVDLDCNGTSDDHGDGDDTDASGNVSYVAIGSDGELSEPPSCAGSSYGAWCIDATNRLNGTDGVAAAGVATFNGRIYIVGGLDGDGHTGNIYYNDFDASTGAPNGAWETSDTTTAGAQDVAYTYAYARANPASAGSNPGNLYIFGGCGTGIGTGLSCEAAGGAEEYLNDVYKCNISTTGSVSGCTTTGQTQLDSDPDTGGSQGLGIHSGTVNANYIYLIGGYSSTEVDKDEVLIAKFDNSNNVVESDGAGTSTWTESPNRLSVGRRRGFSFGYNGHIYSVGGFDQGGETEVLPFIEWSKMDVSDGSIDPFVTSTVQINPRWGLSVAVSNSYAYVFGGCDNGSSPSGCNSFEPAVQTFQLYNNESGAVNDFTAQTDDQFAADEDRIGAAAAVYNGYLYVAGGCTNIGCTTVTDNVQFTQLSSSTGEPTGNWASTTDSTLPAARAWGRLEVAGGTLYYMGGQTATSTDERPEVYYGTPSSGNVSSWNSVGTSYDLPDGRTQFGSAVWNNRLYVVGGIAQTGGAVSSTVYVSPQLNNGGDITSAWSSTTAFNVARTGAAVTAYANNLYLFGGFDNTNYLNDSQFTQINSDGSVDAWTYSTSLPEGLRDATAVSANGYIYLVGGRSATSTCTPSTLITPIVANTTIATGNNPTGTGEWYETNVRYTGDRYGAAVAYENGKIYTMAGGCSTILDCSTGSVCNYFSTVKSQPQVAKYSRMIDTDTDVFPTSWLMNGIDNDIGARWQVRYRSMHDLDDEDTPAEDCGTSATMAEMTTWGQETNYGDVTLGNVATYMPLDDTVEGSTTDFSDDNINCARYYYFFISIDASKTFGYPEDVNRGPTIADVSLFFTSDPSKRLKHGKTFTGGEQQPLDTPCRVNGASPGDPNYNCPLP